MKVVCVSAINVVGWSISNVELISKLPAIDMGSPFVLCKTVFNFAKVEIIFFSSISTVFSPSCTVKTVFSMNLLLPHHFRESPVFHLGLQRYALFFNLQIFFKHRTPKKLEYSPKIKHNSLLYNRLKVLLQFC